MEKLTRKVRASMMGYARKGLNSYSEFTHNDENTMFSVVTIVPGDHRSFMSLLARIISETIVIERDQNDKPLVDALVQSGISRKQIILAYAGEPVPEPT